MSFIRPQPSAKLTISEKRQLLHAYYAEYREWAKRDPAILKQKLPRDAFAHLLDRIGELLLHEATVMASQPGAISQFLGNSPLPSSLTGRLPNEFRVFCLAVNALKQWAAAEQAATDRYLLGGTARAQCRAAADSCILSGEPLTPSTLELHHPARDGRPPIPVSKQAHAQLEGQVSGRNEETLRGTLLAIKRKGARSWVQLRRGCQDLLGLTAQHSTPKVAASSRTFARQAANATSKNYQELLGWLDEHSLG
jgi:hypothetical protein